MRPPWPRDLPTRRRGRRGVGRPPARPHHVGRGMAVPALWRLRGRPAPAPGPADEAPLVLRGKALRQATILRILAVERGARAIVLIAVAYAILRFKASQGALQRLLDRDLPAFRGARHPSSRRCRLIRDRARCPPRPDHPAVDAVVAGRSRSPPTLSWRASRRWACGGCGGGVSTSPSLRQPPSSRSELYELLHHLTRPSWWRWASMIAAVVYLVVAKRLFGVRGGSRHSRGSAEPTCSLEMEQAATSRSAAPFAQGPHAAVVGHRR